MGNSNKQYSMVGVALAAMIAIVLITLIVYFFNPLKMSSSSISQDTVGAALAPYDDRDNGGGYTGGTGSGTITPPKVVKSFIDCKPNGICDVNNDSLINSADTELILESLIGESTACSGADKARCDLNGDGQVTVADIGILSTILPSAKDMSLYQSKEVFIISSRDWQSVVMLAPVTTWTGNETSCTHVANTPANTCVYPTLILHDETATSVANGFDADSILYFLRQYQPTKVTLVGPTPQGFDDLLLAAAPIGAGLTANKISRINTTQYLAYWATYPVIVYAKNDYATALVASTYASLIDEPLIIQGSVLDNPTFFTGKVVACVDIIDPRCSENYTLNSLQQQYIKYTGTDKIIVVNPHDLNIVMTTSFKTSSISTPLKNVFTANSLAAPFLAAAKQELIIPINSTNYSIISNTIKQWVTYDMYDASGKTYMRNNGYGLLKDTGNAPQVSLYKMDISSPAKVKSRVAFWYYATPLVLHHNAVMWSEGSHRLMRYNPTTGTTILKISDNPDVSIGPITPDYYSNLIAYYTLGYDAYPSYNYTFYIYNTSISNLSLARKKITSVSRPFYDSSFPQYIDISNNMVAWTQPSPSMNSTNIVCDIYTANLTSPDPTPRYELTAACGAVSLYNNKIVFKNNVNEVVVYDYSSKTITAIPHVKQYSKKIVDGKIVVIGLYGALANTFDIYLYNVLDNTKTLIKSNIVNSNLITNYMYTQNGAYNVAPTIYNNIVTWVEYEGGTRGACLSDSARSCTTNYGDAPSGCSGAGSYCQPTIVKQYTISTGELKTLIDSAELTSYRPLDPVIVPTKEGITPKRGIVSQPISDGTTLYYQLNRDNDYYVYGYLTIMGTPNAIPSQEYFDLLPPYDNARALDQTEYADVFLDDRYPDMATGRIQGITISDISSYVARDLFYTETKKSNSSQFLASGFDYGMYFANDWAKSFRDAGYLTGCNVINMSSTNMSRVTACTPNNDSEAYITWPTLFKNRMLTSYFGHGGDYWAGVYSGDLPELDNTLVFSDACSNCASMNTQTFCEVAIRKGAILHAGTLSISWTGTKLPHDMMNALYGRGFDANGKAINTTGQAASMYYNNGMFRHMWTIQGDPTVTIQPTTPLQGDLRWD